MINHTFLNKKSIKEAVEYVQQITVIKPQLALILGSGLGHFVKNVYAISSVRSTEIPNYPIPSVQGHEGKLVFGYLQKDSVQSVPLLIFQGRVHFYESASIECAMFPIILANQLGIQKLIITNAAGGINGSFVIGDLMLIIDILHLTFMRSLSSKNIFIKNRKKYFDNGLKQIALQCASQLSMPLRQGTYCWLKGPSYETPAEIQMLKRIGVDAVGMSTVPEIFIASILRMKTLAISLISNMASGISPAKLSHTEIAETIGKGNEIFSKYMENLILSIK